MWQLLKSEFNYNFLFWGVLGVLFPLYSIFVITDTQLLSGPKWEIDYWGAIFSLFLYLFYYVMWAIKINEKRIRLYTLLPVSQKNIALSRFMFLILPILIFLFYLILIHFEIIHKWYLETGSIIAQLGAFLISFSAFIILRDVWHSLKIKSYLIRSIILILWVIPLAAFIWFIFTRGRLLFYDFIGFNYGQLIFPLSGLIIGSPSLYSIKLRRSFFS